MSDDRAVPSGARTLRPLALHGRGSDPGPWTLLRGKYVACEATRTEARFPNRVLHGLACTDGVFAALRQQASASTVGMWAVRAPFQAKGRLKARRYRWMPESRGGIPRSRWTGLAPEREAAEIDWPREHDRHPVGARAPLTKEFRQRPNTDIDRWRRDPPLGAGPSAASILH